MAGTVVKEEGEWKWPAEVKIPVPVLKGFVSRGRLRGSSQASDR
jgi:hypothetical protein